MLKEIKEVEHFDRLGRRFVHELLFMKCDVCGTEWETRGSKARIVSRNVHTCSMVCKKSAHKSGGVIERQRAATNLERYGAENTYAARSCKEKIISTLRDRYGVDHALQNSDFLQKQRQTTINRYGENPIASKQIQKRIKRTMVNKYGVERPMQLLHVRQAMMCGSIAKWGVPFPMQSVEFQKHIFEQRDKISWMSKPEKAFRVLLESKYGKENVKVQQLIERKWSIDFYIVSLDTWVSFDGVYWHGLDRDIDVIKSSTRIRDQAIYKKWLKDRELDTYVDINKLRLIRITDVEFKTNPQSCLFKIEYDEKTSR